MQHKSSDNTPLHWRYLEMRLYQSDLNFDHDWTLYFQRLLLKWHTMLRSIAIDSLYRPEKVSISQNHYMINAQYYHQWQKIESIAVFPHLLRELRAVRMEHFRILSFLLLLNCSYRYVLLVEGLIDARTLKKRCAFVALLKNFKENF